MHYENFNAIINDKNYFVIAWNLLLRCNLDCSYCFDGAHDNVSKPPSVDTLISAATKMTNFLKTEREGYRTLVTYAGGEPFIVKDVDKFFKFMSENGIMEQGVLTNGTAPVSVYERSLKYITNLGISWHFETDNDKHLMRVIEKIHTVSQNVIVYILDHIEHQDRVKAAIKFCQDIGVRFSIKTIRLLDENGSYAIKMKEPIQIETDLKDDVSTNYTNMSIVLGDKHERIHAHELYNHNQVNFKGWRCDIGIQSCMIRPNGDIYRATCRQGGIVGNVYNDDVVFIPNEGVTCQAYGCFCAGDLFMTKAKKGYEHYLDPVNTEQLIAVGKL